MIEDPHEIIRADCAIAGRPQLAEQFIASGASPEMVRRQLLNLRRAEAAAPVPQVASFGQFAAQFWRGRETSTRPRPIE